MTGSDRKLRFAAAVCVGFAAVEVAGGLLSGSLALLADALHVLLVHDQSGDFEPRADL